MLESDRKTMKLFLENPYNVGVVLFLVQEKQFAICQENGVRILDKKETIPVDAFLDMVQGSVYGLKKLDYYKDPQNQLNTAVMVAIYMHDGQKDIAGDPYSYHLNRVDDLIRISHFGENTEDIRTVAWLHDVLEDTSMTMETLLAFGFSKTIVGAVVAMTKQDGEEYMRYIHRLAQNQIARKVKMADLLDNMNLTRLTKKHGIRQIKDTDLKRVEKYVAAFRYLKSLEPENKM